MASLTEQIASQTGVEAYVGIGTGTATAVAAAKRGLCVPRQDTYDFLATLSVGELIAFLPDSEKQEYELTLRLLHTLGIRTVQHLRELGATQLVTRCGLIGQRLWTLGEGGDLFVKQTGTRIAEVHVHMDFDPPVAQASHALVGARRAAQDFVDQLERQGLQAQAVRIELLGGLIGEQAVNISGRTWSFFDTSRSAQVAERIIWQINAWQGTTHAHVGEAEGSLQGIELTALDILSHFATGTLWGSAPQLEKVSQTVARVQMLAGEESVRQPRLFGGLDPRSRTLLVPWGKEEEGDPREGEWRGAIRSAPQVLFDIPLACRVIGDDTHGAWGPVWVDRRGVLTGTPRRLVVLEGCEEISPGGYELTDFSGLWPIKGTWWSPNPAERAARCYLRIRTVQGIDVLLVHQERNWWVEGIYSSQKSLWR